MRAAVLFVLSGLSGLGAQAQTESAAQVSYARSVGVPLNAVLLFDKAMDAWTWTFGKEPGARLQVTDRGAGLIEGSARVNYRSAQLGLREETMGFVQYRVVINVKAGECRLMVSELTHTGNRNTGRGGVHLGLLVRGEAPSRRPHGVSGGNAKRIHAELKQVAEARILTMLQAFEARLRAQAEP